MDRTLHGPDRQVVSKAVGYVIQNEKLLVFTHDDVPITVTGVQVPAGTIEQTESPEDAVVREVFEETGVAVRIVTVKSTRVVYLPFDKTSSVTTSRTITS
ncbi:NUDIX family protein [Corynebacterium glutamicum]|uniref:NUDIX domain-containing protein n=1 Tax=Corynebacterium glutamicum TaxID=1718 RepID=UPI00097B91C7|nr:NUDIX domain-containing protein [Corynebacterium glutamicum]GAV96787.1 NUDIX family protein [Corynebacterium glutamicum]